MPLRWLTNCTAPESPSIIACLIHQTPGKRFTTGEPVPALLPEEATLEELKARGMVGVYEVEAGNG